MVVQAVIDGVSLPRVGWTTGWALLLFFLIQYSRGKLMNESAHLEQMEALRLAHAAALAAKDSEIDRIEHDRQEWRAESRIKDAQNVEKDEQIREKDVQLRHMAELGRTLDSVLTAIRPLQGGPQ